MINLFLKLKDKEPNFTNARIDQLTIRNITNPPA